MLYLHPLLIFISGLFLLQKRVFSLSSCMFSFFFRFLAYLVVFGKEPQIYIAQHLNKCLFFPILSTFLKTFNSFQENLSLIFHPIIFPTQLILQCHMALELAEGGGLARPKILERVLRFRKIALVAAFVGCFFYCQWCFDPANMEVTRISEHSLMPGLVTPRFEKSGIAIQMYRKLSDLPKYVGMKLRNLIFQKSSERVLSNSLSWTLSKNSDSSASLKSGSRPSFPRR